MINFNQKSYHACSRDVAGTLLQQSILISPDQTGDIQNLLQTALSNLSLPGSNTSNPIALCLYYSDSNYSNYDSLKAVLYYFNEDGKYFANYWKLNNSNNFEKVDALCGTSYLVSSSDMYRLAKSQHLDSANLLLIIDYTQIATTQYPSVFQVQVAHDYEVNAPSGGGGGGDPIMCDDVPECHEHVAEYCTFSESDLGPIRAGCLPKMCSHEIAVQILTANAEDGSSVDADKNFIYKTRNEFLLNSVKGKQYIDDYYYVGYILSNSLPLGLSEKYLDLHSMGFLQKLAYFDNAGHSSDTLFYTSTKNKISDMCDIAELLSDDDRFQAIISKVRSDINKYENKSISYITSDF